MEEPGQGQTTLIREAREGGISRIERMGRQ